MILNFSGCFLPVIWWRDDYLFSPFLMYFLIKCPHNLDNKFFDSWCIPSKYNALVYTLYCRLGWALWLNLAIRKLVTVRSKEIKCNFKHQVCTMCRTFFQNIFFMMFEFKTWISFSLVKYLNPQVRINKIVNQQCGLQT